ncbi:MAG: four helix bundle protein [Pyrinomonadaceae bacterium]|nr:four helix bundle protein [Pyrinomonadaceae bacterium]
MATFRRFEEINAWQTARKSTARIYTFSNGSLGRDFSLCDQMKRASISIMANIAEGHGRRTNKSTLQTLPTQ